MTEKSLHAVISEKILRKAKELISQGKVINVKITETGIVGEVRGSRKTIHSCSINNSGELSCGCTFQVTHPDKLCSHLTAVLLQADAEDLAQRVIKRMSKEEIRPIFSKTDIFETSLRGLNELLKGGLPLRSLFGIYGKFKAGKSIFCQQLAWEVMKWSGMNALLFDTESDYFKPDALPIWATRFNKRYELDIQLVRVSCIPKWSVKKNPVIDDLEFNFYPEEFDEDKQTAFILDEGKFEILIALHGKPVAPRLKGGKIDLMPMETGLYVFYVNQSKLGNFIEERQIKFVSYDSITRPFLSFHGGRVNYPVRNEAANLWFAQIDELLKMYNLVSVCTHRETDNPTNQFSRPEPKGGRAIGHWFKRMIHLQKIGSTVKRRLKVYRIPTEAEWGEGSWSSERRIFLSNHGFKDLEGE